MSPEQAQGTPLDGRSDLWALAIMLFEMISGRPPFEGPTLTSILVAVLTSPRPRLRDRGIDVPESLEQALDRALAKTAAERFPEVASFRLALAEIGGLSRRTQPQALAIAPTQAMATPQAQPAVVGPLDVSFAPTQAATPITPM